MSDLAKADWARCLGRLPVVPDIKLKLLTDSLSLFKADDTTTIGQWVAAMLPVGTYLGVRCQKDLPGDDAQAALSVLSAALQQLPAAWSVEEANAAQAQLSITELLSTLSSALCSPTASSSLREHLSQSLLDTLVSLLQHIASQDSLTVGDATGAQLFLTAVTTSKAGRQHSSLPLMPHHAAQLLGQICSCTEAMQQAGWGADYRLLLLAAQALQVSEHGAVSEQQQLLELLQMCAQQVELHAAAANGELHSLQVQADEQDSSAAALSETLVSFQVLRAAAAAASAAVSRLTGAGEPLAAAAQQLQLGELCGRLLGVVEGTAKCAPELGHFEPMVEQMLREAAALLLALQPLLLGALQLELDTSELAARLRGLLLASAQQAGQVHASIAAVTASTCAEASSVAAHQRGSVALSEVYTLCATSVVGHGNIEAGGDGCWDVSSELITAEQLEGGKGGSSGAMRLCRAAAEVLSQLLAASWAAGMHSTVKAVSELPMARSCTEAEQQVAVLAVGRLACLLAGDGSFTRMVTLLLSEALVAPAAELAAAAYGAVAATLAAVAAACVGAANGKSCWEFEQVLQLLLRLYHQPSQPTRLLMYGQGSEHSSCAGMLAKALERLAAGVADAKPAVRRELQASLLGLFSELASRRGGYQHAQEDLQALLPALAAACAAADSQMVRLLAASRSLHSYGELQQAVKADWDVVRLMRNLWLYLGLTQLPVEPAWRAAAGVVAAATPLLFVGPSPHRNVDSLERLKLELGDKLEAMMGKGDMASGRSLSARAQQLLDPSGSAGLQLPHEPVQLAYLLAVATAELARVELLPLAKVSELGCPLAMGMAYLEVVDPGSAEMVWYQAVVARVFGVYLARLQQAASSGDPEVSASADACAEQLACTLVQRLAPVSGCVEGSQPKAVQVADSLLGKLLAAFPVLLWSQQCVKLLLSVLEQEEGDVPLGELHTHPVANGGGQAAQPGMAWRWLQRWVSAAASAAPSRTEALLHQFLSRSSGVASEAAFRRAADLFGICMRARSASQLATLEGMSDGALALCQKQRYEGYVQGVQQQLEEGAAAAGSVAQHALLQLAAAEQQHLPQAVLQDRFLAAAALLACPAGGLPNAASLQLLRSICSAPLARFNPEMMQVAVFAWTWVSTANSELLLPLLAELCQAWSTTVDRRQGLFSEEHHTAHEPEEQASAQHDPETTCALRAHHLWLGYLLEHWATSSSRGGAEAAAAARMLMHALQRSLADPSLLSMHPLAAGARFRLLQLALRCAARLLQQQKQQQRREDVGGGSVASGEEGAAAAAAAQLPAAVLGGVLLQERAIRAGLMWFKGRPDFYHKSSLRQAEEAHQAIQDFMAELGSSQLDSTAGAAAHELRMAVARSMGSVTQPGHPVWGSAPGDRARCVSLLQFLCRAEVERLKVWAHPISSADSYATGALASSAKEWQKHIETSWQVEPALAVALLERYPAAAAARSHLEALVTSHAHTAQVQCVPGAAMLLATAANVAANAPQLCALHVWAPAHAVEALELLSGAASRHPAARAYAMRCLHNTPPQRVVFFLPQLVQSLRFDADQQLQRFFLATAQKSDLFAHQLMWALQSEEQPPPDAFDPEVKRSGWHAPKDTGLWQVAGQLRTQLVDSLSPQAQQYWEAESRYFEDITSVSAALFKYSKEERKTQAVRALEAIAVQRQDLYVPTNPSCRVITHIPTSGTPMQSAAKVPILVAFKVEAGAGPAGREDGGGGGQQGGAAVAVQRSVAVIVKTGDDIRQDVLALQVIKILKSAFERSGLDLYLAPYGCLPTGYEKGIIEVVPNTKSRAALGELSDRGLYDIFLTEFGAPGSPQFERARRNFIVSEAGYAIASYLLQAKDRHNGNILVDAEGHLVHIDFGFILEISPGGNLGFESAAFKLSHEMTQLLDPGNTRNSPHFKLFEELVIRGYLVARTVAEPIIATVALMAESGLPCYGRGQPVANLRRRFHLEMSERQAAAYMRGLIQDAYQKWTTGFYDYIQSLQNRIPY